MTLTPGTRLDAYEILGPVGAGGMGEVYRARDSVLKREVAIKVLPAYFSQDPDRLRRFEQEAQAAAALNHPNILVVYRFGTFEGAPYLVSELLEGGTLGQLLKRGPLAVRKSIDYGVQLAGGLAAAHQKGIVHRDLKPDNLFVTKDGRVKILDFGLAKLTQAKPTTPDGPTITRNEQTGEGHVLGTVGYMSPEQVRGQAADHRADVFAFGAILYEMLTGKRAFRKPTSTETMTAILNEEPASISQISPGTPPALLRIVHRCLEKDPEQRFHSASDLAFALEALSDSGSSSVAAVDQGSHSRWVWVAATAVIVTLAAVLIAWWRMPPAAPVVESVTQLTDDSEPKQGRLVSDGSRVYFNEGPTASWKIAQISVSGGRTALVDTRLVNPQIAGLAPDGSALLALVGGNMDPSYPLWSIPLPAGEPRRLGNLEVVDAGVLPDGRIIFVTGTDLFVADKDGLNPHKLVSVAGSIGGPDVSPDGKRIVFRMTGVTDSLLEIATDGTGLHTILTANQGERFGTGAWNSTGRYLAYSVEHGRGSDLWALPMQTGIFYRSREPIRLTNGPLFYSSPHPSPDGKQILAIGTKRRGELVRYDTQSHQFVPFLSGISAISPSFSKDGQWVAYTSYPDHTLWRSRTDGSERRQLTYPPMEVAWPSISPDGTKVTFASCCYETYEIGMDGGPPHRIASQSGAAKFSPDQNLLIITSVIEGMHPGDKNSLELQLLDLRTGKISVLPSSEGKLGGEWITQDTIVAVTQVAAKLVLFDFKTQKWTDLGVANFVNWAVSRDGKYLTFTTGGAEPKVQRLRFADRQIETITSLKDLRRVVDSVELGGTQINIAPDGSPVFTRDIGSQEIYALSVRWP